MSYGRLGLLHAAPLYGGVMSFGRLCLFDTSPPVPIKVGTSVPTKVGMSVPTTVGLITSPLWRR